MRTSTLSFSIRRSAWLAKVAGSDRPSAISHFNFRPATPPLALISSSAMTSTSSSDFSLIARGPVCEWIRPTMIGARTSTITPCNDSTTTGREPRNWATP